MRASGLLGFVLALAIGCLPLTAAASDFNLQSEYGQGPQYQPAPPPGPPLPRSGDRQHDGFALAFGAGFGYSHVSTSVAFIDMSISGFTVDFDMAIGYAVLNRLIIHANILAQVAVAPTMTVNGQSVTSSDTNLGLFGFGGGLTYYFMPVNLYISTHFNGGAMFLERSGSAGATDLGFVLLAKVGKEWWVGRQWGLGLSGWFTFGSIPDKGGAPTWTWLGGGAGFSATYN